MIKPMKAYDVYQVVLVPFPFVDSAEAKKRPAVILSSDLSFNRKSRSCVMSMITSATHTPWPCDVDITDLSTAGLPVKSIIRMKLFTLDQRLILRPLGKLSQHDQNSLSKTLQILLGL